MSALTGADQNHGIKGYHMVKALVPSNEKVRGYVSKDESKNSFIEQVIRQKSKLMSPHDYSPKDYGGFSTSPKDIHFAHNKAAKKSIF